MYKVVFIFLLFVFSFSKSKKLPDIQEIAITLKISEGTQDPYAFYNIIFKKNPNFMADSFDFPVGKPDAKGYYNALKFGKNAHLGDDWNGLGGGNTDLGDSIYSIASGYVTFAEDIGGGWGNVIRIVHQYKGTYYESLYAHCDTIKVKKGSFIKKGTLIGTIGNAHGMYLAHLHMELRSNIFMDIGGGYAVDTSGYIDPTKFIKNN